MKKIDLNKVASSLARQVTQRDSTTRQILRPMTSTVRSTLSGMSQNLSARVSSQGGARTIGLSGTTAKLAEMSRLVRGVRQGLKGNIQPGSGVEGPSRPAEMVIASCLAEHPRFKDTPLDQRVKLGEIGVTAWTMMMGIKARVKAAFHGPSLFPRPPAAAAASPMSGAATVGAQEERPDLPAEEPSAAPAGGKPVSPGQRRLRAAIRTVMENNAAQAQLAKERKEQEPAQPLPSPPQRPAPSSRRPAESASGPTVASGPKPAVTQAPTFEGALRHAPERSSTPQRRPAPANPAQATSSAPSASSSASSASTVAHRPAALGQGTSTVREDTPEALTSARLPDPQAAPLESRPSPAKAAVAPQQQAVASPPRKPEPPARKDTSSKVASPSPATPQGATSAPGQSRAQAAVVPQPPSVASPSREREPPVRKETPSKIKPPSLPTPQAATSAPKPSLRTQTSVPPQPSAVASAPQQRKSSVDTQGEAPPAKAKPKLSVSFADKNGGDLGTFRGESAPVEDDSDVSDFGDFDDLGSESDSGDSLDLESLSLSDSGSEDFSPPRSPTERRGRRPSHDGAPVNVLQNMTVGPGAVSMVGNVVAGNVTVNGNQVHQGDDVFVFPTFGNMGGGFVDDSSDDGLDYSDFEDDDFSDLGNFGDTFEGDFLRDGFRTGGSTFSQGPNQFDPGVPAGPNVQIDGNATLVAGKDGAALRSTGPVTINGQQVMPSADGTVSLPGSTSTEGGGFRLTGANIKTTGTLSF